MQYPIMTSHRFGLSMRMLGAAVLAMAAAAALAGESPVPSRIATFHADATPPIGHPMTGGYNSDVTSIEDPLDAKGVVIEQGDDRYVLCSIDWCGLSNASHWLFRDKLALAAGTDPSRVAVHCTHTHTSILADDHARELLAATEKPLPVHDPKWLEETAERLAAAVKEAVGRLEPFDRVGTGEAKVDRVASSRRIFADGKLHSRMSATTDAFLQSLPEGLIDPMVKTVTFARGDEPLARLHYYATHPQSFYGDGRVCSDVPGFARDRLEEEEGVFQVYFTGCGGNIAMGKYNDGTPRARDALTQRLYAGMKQAAANTRYAPVGRIIWRMVPLHLPLRDDGVFNDEKSREVIANVAAPNSRRLEAAEYLAFARRIDTPILVTSLQVGDLFLLHLPAEAFVEYQLYAQEITPNRFTAVAAFGEYDPVYICTKNAFGEGGYEPTESMSGLECETVLKEAIRKALGVEDDGKRQE